MKQKHTDPYDYLGKTVKVIIDRPIGSKHPQHEIYYLVNYGFIPNTNAPDGEELDVYVLGVFVPVKKFTGRCIAVIHRTDNGDDKLVIAPKGKEYSDIQIKALTEFQEQYFKSEIIRTRKKEKRT